DLVKKIKPDMQINLKPYQQELEKEIASAKLYPESREVLEELRKKNIKLGLISNLASPYKEPFFEFGLNEYFDEVLFSCDVGLRKTNPKIYQKMIKNLNINPSQVLMTGDNVRADVDGPRSIGMNAIHLDRRNASLNKISTLEGVFQYL
ncbi:MAG: HAD family hydrolase, partial [Nanoarchaeota archaeon]|nr:HAD family hydrolase [Nanoarchaeota archaeon]